MEIEVKVEDEAGSIHFDGVIRQNEVNFILNVGINYLMAKGAFPFMVQDPENKEESTPAPGTDIVQ